MSLNIVGVCTSCNNVISINNIPITFVNGTVTAKCLTCPETVFQPPFDINGVVYTPPEVVIAEEAPA
jgi:hypothetical protein